MKILGVNYNEGTGSYDVFYRTKSGIKSYFSIFEGFKVKDMYVMHANKMTWEEFTELPEIEEWVMC